jgi:predicted S18 family serine protease
LRNSSKLATILLLSLILNAALAYAYVVQLTRVGELKSTLEAYASEAEELSRRVAELSYRLNLTLSQLEFYKRIAEAGGAPSGVEGGLALGSSKVHLVAVRSTERGYEGVVLECYVKLLRGSGRVLVDTEPKIGIDLQSSLRVAVSVAEGLTGFNFSRVDVVARVVGEEEVEVVDGPSAGAAIAAAVISAVRGEGLNDTVYITGTVNPDGSVGQVGGVLEKALAAAEHGAKLFMVPKGQRSVSVPTLKVVERRFGPVIIRQEELMYIDVDVEEFLRSRGFSVKVVEVENVAEAYRYLAEARQPILAS